MQTFSLFFPPLVFVNLETLVFYILQARLGFSNFLLLFYCFVSLYFIILLFVSIKVYFFSVLFKNCFVTNFKCMFALHIYMLEELKKQSMQKKCF